MGLTYTIGRLLERVAPSVARRLRDVWYTANGGRIETLAGILDQEMHGHRQHIDQRLNQIQAYLGTNHHDLDERLNRIQAHLSTNHHDLDERLNQIQAHLSTNHHDLGQRLNELQAHLDATDRRLDTAQAAAARFNSRIEETGGTGAAFTVQDSLRRLEDAPRSSGPRIAVVSVLPPMQTGIAEYSLQTFEASPVPVDVFTPFPDAGAYMAAVHRLPRPGGPLAIHALETLSFALATRRYEAVIWALGNSAHHLPVLRLLRETRHLDPLAPHWVQLHDPALFHLTRLYADQIGVDPATLLRPAAVTAMPQADWPAVTRSDIRTIVGHIGLPARALFADLPLHGVILHSRAALDLLLPDWPELDRLQKRLLYLPVIDHFTPRIAPPGGGLRIGSFGYPSPYKGTDIILAAFRQLRRRRPEARLVLAGYNAARFSLDEGLGAEPGLEVYDNPPMKTLAELMDGVDVAVQLRTHNGGESSGIVPQLLSRDVPTLTSAIGAFREYGEAVRAMPVGCGPEALCAAILDEAAQPALRRAARRGYVETHSAADFCAALLNDAMALPVSRRA